MRGLPVSAVQREHIVQVWFGSPTGDSSDSILLDIPCHNADQARGLADEYSKFIKGIYPVYEISETTQSVINDLMQNVAELEKSLENANQKIQALTTTLITHYEKSWFDQTVRF